MKASAIMGIVSLSLFLIGAALTVLSMLFSSFIPLFAGLGMLFWGSILIYIRSEDYVKSELLQATNLSYFASLDEMLKNTPEMSGKGVYLPSRVASGVATSRVYFFEKSKKKVTLSEIIKEKGIIGHPKSSMIAPGNELLRLFEKRVGKSFAGADYSFFQRAIPGLVEDDFELAQKVEIETGEDNVKIRLKNPSALTFLVKAKEQLATIDSIGLPISSAIACALADTTDRPVIIRSHHIDDEGKGAEIEYAVLGYEEALS